MLAIQLCYSSPQPPSLKSNFHGQCLAAMPNPPSCKNGRGEYHSLSCWQGSRAALAHPDEPFAGVFNFPALKAPSITATFPTGHKFWTEGLLSWVSRLRAHPHCPNILHRPLTGCAEWQLTAGISKTNKRRKQRTGREGRQKSIVPCSDDESLCHF